MQPFSVEQAAITKQMPDRMTPQQRHECMSHIRSRDTRPELAVRRGLWSMGFRFRVNVRSLPGTPDIVLPKYRTAIFVNGCFWHGHQGCRSYTVPKTNTAFWKEKVERNRARDQLDAQRLESIGWSVVTVWECELGKTRLEKTLDRLESELKANMLKWEQYRRRRREDRQFAIEQARRRREIAAAVEAELAERLGAAIPESIKRMSKKEL